MTRGGVAVLEAVPVAVAVVQGGKGGAVVKAVLPSLRSGDGEEGDLDISMGVDVGVDVDSDADGHVGLFGVRDRSDTISPSSKRVVVVVSISALALTLFVGELIVL